MGYRSAVTRSRVVMGLLLAGVALSALACLTHAVEIVLLQRVSLDDATFGGAEIFSGCTALIQLLVFVATVVAWCFWIHRAYANLEALGYRHQRFTPGWAAGWYFMPLLNLIRPYQVMREIWNASRPGVEHDDSLPALDMRMNAAPAPVVAWWAAWLIENFVGIWGARSGVEIQSVESAIRAAYANIVSDGLEVVAALLAAYVVRAVTRMQEERAAQIAAASLALSEGPTGP